MKKKRRRNLLGPVSWWIFFASLVLLAVSVDVYLAKQHLEGDWIDLETPVPSASHTPTAKSSATPKPSAVPSTIPSQSIISMSFIPQAPFANWDALHEDACEETSLLMVAHYLENKPIESREAGDAEITDLVHRGESMGHGLSITLDQLNDLADEYYGLKSGRVETGITVDDIKAEIAAGRPVIVGAAGKVLPNPHFSNGGPNYHMLVVKGYDAEGFITNDPGIRQGEDFRYTYDGLYDAIHDWDPDNILNGAKSYLVFDGK